MRILSYIRIALLIMCCLFTTPFGFAHLAMDSHIPENLTYSESRKVGRNIWKEFKYTAAMVSVSIDALTYDPAGNGVATLDGSSYVMNITHVNVAVIKASYDWKYSNRWEMALI